MATLYEDADLANSEGHAQTERRKSSIKDAIKQNFFEEGTRENLNAVFKNPLAGIPRDDLLADVELFCEENDLMDQLENMKKGALISQDPDAVMYGDVLSESEKEVLRTEATKKWNHPWQLYWLCVMCSLVAAAQGMDETANNGALPFYPQFLGITVKDLGSKAEVNDIIGLVVGAPYLACAVLGCWLTDPLNAVLGRRGTIFICCAIGVGASIGEAFTYNWPNLFVARFFLGLSIGANSATVPVYGAECAPARIRGALVMQWQVWTAFGIMLGNIVGVAFGGLSPDLAWRLILGSTFVPPLIVMILVFTCPESPRWLIGKGRVQKAFRSFQRLRKTDLQACRDLYYAHIGVELERQVDKGKNFFTKFMELFTVPRNRRASWAAWIVMFGQQFCGVNIIAYYSTEIFIEGGYSLDAALLASLGTGILNWVFALPAFLTIDRFGRRPLLLFTFPWLAGFMLWTGFAFFAHGVVLRTALVTTGFYLFEVFYSPGMGPVPFTYSAEVFPMQVREVGVSFATATLWAFNFILSFTFPRLRQAFTVTGAFGFYAAWNIVLWVLVLLFLPETKGE